MSNADRVRKWRERHPEEARRQSRVAQARTRGRRVRLADLFQDTPIEEDDSQ